MLTNHFRKNFKTVSGDDFIYTKRCSFGKEFHHSLPSHRYKLLKKFQFIGAFILPPITPKINGLLFSCSILLLKTKVILGLQGNALPHEQSTALSSGLDFRSSLS